MGVARGREELCILWLACQCWFFVEIRAREKKGGWSWNDLAEKTSGPSPNILLLEHGGGDGEPRTWKAPCEHLLAS